jgi:hypothetical protein
VARKVAKHHWFVQTGVVVQEFLDHTTPSAPSDEAPRLFLDVAATPPPAEEGSRLPQRLFQRAVPPRIPNVMTISLGSLASWVNRP